MSDHNTDHSWQWLNNIFDMQVPAKNAHGQSVYSVNASDEAKKAAIQQHINEHYLFRPKAQTPANPQRQALGEILTQGMPNPETKLYDIKTTLDKLETFVGEHYIGKGEAEHREKEARYMGAQDFSSWLLNHDESSFRQERAWFKVKPALVIQYQANLMADLERIRSNIGNDSQATNPQVTQQLYTESELQQKCLEARKQAAKDIFNLAHEYAQNDKTMVGSEELRNYHYFNAIHKIGEFDGR